MSKIKHDILKSNLKILEWMNEISIAEETYSEKYEAEIQHLIYLIMPPFQRLHVDHKEWMGVVQGVHSRAGEGHVPE